MRILVTGAAGFIGAHVAAVLRAGGHDVVGLDSLHPMAHRVAELPAGVRRGDVRDAGVDVAARRAVMA